MPAALNAAAGGASQPQMGLPVPPIPPDQAGGALTGQVPPQQDADGALATAGQQPIDPQDAERLRRIEQAKQTLAAQAIMGAAGIRPPSWQQPGATNVPALAAAAGLLSPTRTGGFAESLGDAFGKAAGATEAQRRLEMDEAMRRAQLEDTAAYRAGMLGVRQQHEDNYGDRTTQMAAVEQARAAWLTARAAMAGASHASEGDILAASIGQLADGKTVNPTTGQPWTRPEAYAYLKGIDARMMSAGASATRADAYTNLAQARIDALRNAPDEKAKDRILRASDEDIAAASRLAAASKDVNGNFKLSVGDALGQVQAARATQSGGTTAGKTAAQPADKVWPIPSPDAIKLLKSNPDKAHLYEQTFGPGSAAKVLGQ